MRRPRRSRWTPFLALGALLAILPATGAQASEHTNSNDGAPTSTDSVEIVRGTAPEWPFQGFFAPALGRFWDTGRGRVHDVSNGVDFGACYEIYVEVDAESVRTGYVSYPDPEAKHYVIPWGDAAYPVVKRDVASKRAASAAAPVQDAGRESIRLTAERIAFTPETISEYSEETENTYTQVVAFRAHNSAERRSYLPLGFEPYVAMASGFVEVESESLPVDDLRSMRDIAEEFGGLGTFRFLPVHGSDGRFYSFSLYNQAHPVCRDIATSFVVDGISGQVVACYDYMMENQTPLVFVATEDRFVLDDFAPPNATHPVDVETCGVRLDGGHPAELLRRMAESGWPGPDNRERAGT